MNLADKQRRSIALALGATLLLVLVYVAVWPFLLLWLWPQRHFVTDQAWSFYLSEVLASLWVFALGGVIGSYLNVVIYRCPRGLSLLGGSRCPRCEAAIRPRDNLPVVGWVLLTGRCRRCRLPISARYPLVELLVAMVFLLLTQLEVFATGVNLPGLGASNLKGAMWNLFDPAWRLIGVLGFHLWLLVALFSWSMIQYDQQTQHNASFGVPRRFFLYTLTIGIVMPLLCVWLRPLDWRFETHWRGEPSLVNVLLTTICGMIAGAIAAAVSLAATLGRQQRKPAWRQGLTIVLASFVAVGLFLGWQATVVVLMLQVMITWAFSLVTKHRGGRHATGMFASFFASLVTIATWAGWVATWRWLFD